MSARPRHDSRVRSALLPARRTPMSSLPNLRVPTLPVIVHKTMQLIDEASAGTAEVGALLAADPALAGTVLRIANSSFHGLREPCVSTERACTILGLRALRNIVVEAVLIQDSTRLRSFGLDLERLWHRSALTGRVCALLARRSRAPSRPDPDEAYLTGLLSDIGQVVLLDNFGDRYAALHGAAQHSAEALHVIEARELGLNHAQAGMVVATEWGLPESVRTGIAQHHGTRKSDYGVAAVYLTIRASQIVELTLAGTLRAAERALDSTAERQHDIRADAVEAAIAHVADDAANSRAGSP